MDPPSSSPESPRRPAHLIDGRYELVEPAGRGGLAVVWRAVHHGPGRFRRTVAVKQMHPHLAAQSLYRDLFHEEARIGSTLQDPNVAQIHDFVAEDDQLYLVMEWVQGIDLATFVRYVTETCGWQTPWELIAAIGVGLLRGLSTAHERKAEEGTPEPIVHRDLSPHNVLITESGRAKLIDFGLSFARDREIEDTDPGMAKGKLAYLAPEIVRGGRPTPQSDQFGVGILLWEALTGQHAFAGDNDLRTYERVANAEIESLKTFRPGLPKGFRELVHRALALDPAHRFSETREMARRLGNVLKGHRGSEDLYAVLGRSVIYARNDLDIGQRTQDPAAESSRPDLHSGLVELLAGDEDKRSGGFRKWVPRFLRKSE